MSIASELNNLRTNISNAYDSINTKGGTVPQNKNTANLATAIDSISGGGGGWVTPVTMDRTGMGAITSNLISMPTIVVGSGVTTLRALFQHESIYNLKEVKMIGGGSQITDVYSMFDSSNTAYVPLGGALKSIDLSGLQVGAVVNFGNFANSCINLETIKLPSMTSAPSGAVDLSSAFNRNEKLTRVDLTELGQNLTGGNTRYLFQNCYALEYVDMRNIDGSTNTSRMFQNCSALSTLILGGSSVLPVASADISGSGITSGICTVYVPDNLVATYKATSPWSTYASQIKGISELPA